MSFCSQVVAAKLLELGLIVSTGNSSLTDFKVLYWPAQPGDPLTIRGASIIAFSVCLFSVLSHFF